MIELVSYRTWQPKRGGGFESAVRVALIKRGRKWMRVLCIDATKTEGLKLWKVPLSHEERMCPLLRKGKAYPMKRALRGFRRMVKAHGASKGAKKFIREAAKECLS